MQVFWLQGKVLHSSEDLPDNDHVSSSCASCHHALQLTQYAARTKLLLCAAASMLFNWQHKSLKTKKEVSTYKAD